MYAITKTPGSIWKSILCIIKRNNSGTLKVRYLNIELHLNFIHLNVRWHKNLKHTIYRIVNMKACSCISTIWPFFYKEWNYVLFFFICSSMFINSAFTHNLYLVIQTLLVGKWAGQVAMTNILKITFNTIINQVSHVILIVNLLLEDA